MSRVMSLLLNVFLLFTPQVPIMSQPKVSIITPAWNVSGFIDEAIASVRRQTLGEWEHLIVNDGSSDDTGRRLDQWAARDPRIIPIHLEENAGPAVARNKALAQARGRYIAFLDSDDLWLPEKLARQLAFMEESNTVFCYSAYYLRNEDKERERLVTPRSVVTYRGLLNATIIATSTAIYDSLALGSLRMPMIHKRQDLGMWLQILRQTGWAQGVTEPLAVIRKRPGSLSSDKLSAIAYTWRLYRDHEKIPFFRRCWHFGNYLVRATLKYIY
jgi:teichuronic acid biosynthesis glycosyltransferase TuaG